MRKEKIQQPGQLHRLRTFVVLDHGNQATIIEAVTQAEALRKWADGECPDSGDQVRITAVDVLPKFTVHHHTDFLLAGTSEGQLP